MPTALALPRIIDSRHPSYLSTSADWDKWRLCYEGGDRFRDAYLEQFSSRETADDFRQRRELSPTPTFAKTAINRIRNSIFQRLGDVVRRNGSSSYHQAINGEFGGVDRRGSTMAFFIGNQVLTELLIMGRSGIYVDMPSNVGTTLADNYSARPYLYYYTAEDVLNFAYMRPEDPSEFQAVLLRDSVLTYDQVTHLPMASTTRFRKVWISQETGLVNTQFYNSDGHEIDKYGNPGGPIELNLTRVPFVMPDIGDSLLKDVCGHQIAILNLQSSDINYALKGNFPFYTEQRDLRGVGAHLKKTASDGTSSAGGQGAADERISVGVTQGRYYAQGMDRPDFIAPPSEPLKASMELQDRLEAQINKLVHLAVTNLSTRASAESKREDDKGLESGLSFIGLVLESTERKIAEYFAAYEHRVVSKRQIATVKYPDSYSLETDLDRIEKSDKLGKLMFTTPSRTAKKEISKVITTTLLGGKVKVDKLAEIHKEIDDAEYTTSDPKTIIEAKEAGLVGERVASVALGFEDDEYLQAQEDHVDRIKRIAMAQGVTENHNSDPAARGVPDLSANEQAGSDERAESRETDMKDSTKDPVRGEGKETGDGD